MLIPLPGRNTKTWVWLVLGVFFIGMAAVGIVTTLQDPACGRMGPGGNGQVCRYDNGNVKTYEAQKRSDQHEGLAATVVGGVISVLCLRVVYLRRRSAAPTPPGPVRPVR